MSEGPERHPFLLRLAHRLLAKAERSSGGSPVRLRLDGAEAPELHQQVEAEVLQRYRLLLDDLSSTQWVALRLARAREFAGWSDRNPQLELLEFEALAQWAGYTPRARRWQARWLQELERHWRGSGAPRPPDPAALLDYLSRNPLVSLADLPLDVATRSLDTLLALSASGRRMPVREASAQAFQGRAKVLDNREELLRLLGAQPGQFEEAPIQLLVDVPARTSEAVFVENLVTFERMADRRSEPWAGSLLLYSAGFRGSAGRIRTRAGSRLYLRAPRARDGDARVVEDWLFGAADLPVFFFGDLDYAGMQILCSLRSVFPLASAWPHGYGFLMDVLASGGGHSPETAAKALQTDPGTTGCRFADDQLLPLMRRQQRFVDQEAFSP